MLGTPVVTFGSVFFNQHPSVAQLARAPKDDWHRLLARAIAQKPDREATIAMIAALQASSYPGFMANPNTFAEVLDPENVRLLTAALVDTLGLTR